MKCIARASATVEESHVKSWEDQPGSREIQFPDLHPSCPEGDLSSVRGLSPWRWGSLEVILQDQVPGAWLPSVPPPVGIVWSL